MKKFIAIAFMLAVCLTGCHKKEKVATPSLSPEQKEVVKNVNISFDRYEKALFSLDINHLADGVSKLYGKYPDFFIPKDCWKNEAAIQGLKGYITDPVMKELYRDVQKKYPDLKALEDEFNKAAKNYLTHFPEADVPKVYTMISGMNSEMGSVWGQDNNVVICLDMYLGKDYKNYDYARIPKFISERCESKYMITDCFTKVISYKHLPDKTLITVLDNMIDKGKQLFFTQTIFPETSEQDILGYSDEKYQWANEHEAQIWQYFIEKNILYSKDDDAIRRMIDETPFTRDFGNVSPGRIGTFLGLRIVNSYMKKHPETTLEELMKLSDYQMILKESGYKPSLKK